MLFFQEYVLVYAHTYIWKKKFSYYTAQYNIRMYLRIHKFVLYGLWILINYIQYKLHK